MQKRAARLLTGANYCAHSEPLFRQLHWNPLVSNINFHKCVLVYKALNGMAPSYIKDKLRHANEVATRTTRSSGRCLLHIPTPKRDFYTSSFSYSAPTLWNDLPEVVRLAPSLNTFKARYWASKI